MKLVTVEQMMELERRAGVPVPQLMENAGLAVAQEAWMLLGDVVERRIVVLAGPGNNGGDGLVAARHLHDWGATTAVYLLSPRPEDDANYRQLLERQVPVQVAEEDADSKALEALLGEAELVVDALLGTGRARPIEGALAEVMGRLAEARRRRPAPRLLAVDLPTGLDADSGAVDPLCLPADLTVVLGHSKVGLHSLPGAEYVGRLQVVEIGLPKELGQELPYELMEGRWAGAALPSRPADANKGTFGRALVVAGSVHYVGAAALATAAAGRAGAGLVTLACARSIYPILAAKLSEATFLPLPDVEGQLSAEAVPPLRQALKDGYDALLVGCGLGQSGYVRAFVRTLLPALRGDGLRGVVIDADGLNALAGSEWWRQTAVPLVVTPHPGEMARLTGQSIEEIQAQRLATAVRFAQSWGCVVVLKGAHTVVAAPDGRARLSPFANPTLATAGTGDVLAGAIASLLAQGLAPFEAASLAVFLHGRAGERLGRELGAAGALAGDLLPLLPLVMQELRE